ncbi:TPA: hypothetical protein N0F65_005596 [Lagenidium giganteum]|uniref:polynucleotide adenylyltransferase n=1 Tax=Lagenidium giganteum TaxID=4803 RepID=A0AAV2Z474_9STRA|nr:TPA: hypothetical protein N0F65_005596 [Lagenidium giganteum]
MDYTQMARLVQLKEQQHFRQQQQLHRFQQQQQQQHRHAHIPGAPPVVMVPNPMAVAAMAMHMNIGAHAAFHARKHSNKLRAQAVAKDLDTSSGARTSCSSQDLDARDPHWDEVSTTSSSDSDAWSSHSNGSSPIGARKDDAAKDASNQSQGDDAVKRQAHHKQHQMQHRTPWMMAPVPVPPFPVQTSFGANQRVGVKPRSKDSVSPHKFHHHHGGSGSAMAVDANGAARPLLTHARQVVQPINIGPPTEYDFRNTNGLMKCLNAIAQLPTPEELSTKHLVVGELQRLVDTWLARSFPEHTEATATLLLGGSWHLKVGLFDSDLDIVTLLPQFVTSECFFGSLYEYLKATPVVTKLVAMKKAAVPILSFQLNGVRIDLLFARYTQNVVPKNLPIHSDEILVGMDATSIRSLSVPRVASLILELVPNGCIFRSCLRIVRLWARRRGLYSNKAGFLGGISWTILVAFICQMFPKATISSVIHRFFSVLSTWNWPTPILISKPTEIPALAESATYQWCPQKNHHDRAHVMPIITPGFPAINSSVNVNMATLTILREELERGKQIMDEMLAKGLSSPAVWQKLFTPSEFLVRYDHYVMVKLHAKDEDELNEWGNYVASRTRKLVETLQHTSPIEHVHPFPQLVRPCASETSGKDDATETAAEDAAVGYYFIGFELKQPPSAGPGNGLQRRASMTATTSSSSDASDVSASSSVASALRYFSATELENIAERRDGMHAELSYSKWQTLPEHIFASGRQAAAGDRARFILSKAHNLNLAMGLGR